MIKEMLKIGGGEEEELKIRGEEKRGEISEEEEEST